MPYHLEGSCQCGAVVFSVDSHAPYPYQLCYCSICRKTGGGGGYAINLSADAASLQIRQNTGASLYHAVLRENGKVHASTAERHFCRLCGSSLWLFSPEWPELVHPMASAIDSELPVPPDRVHIMLDSKAGWVSPEFGPRDRSFPGYPDQSIEEWHRERGFWID